MTRTFRDKQKDCGVQQTGLKAPSLCVKMQEKDFVLCLLHAKLGLRNLEQVHAIMLPMYMYATCKILTEFCTTFQNMRLSALVCPFQYI